MKKSLLIVFSAAGICCVHSVRSQSHGDPDVAPAIQRARSQSVLERFDDELVPDRSQRREMKKQRLAFLRHRRAIIDTLHITERQRKKLLRELYNSPHGSLWDRTVTHLDYEGGGEIPDPD